ncbi:protease modulator HflC [Prosthecomicrobium sp. N25]|uniref:protease modulator HflC n=1 Tax=Prosthecomicrobium sp. N25 TaxID=3129254 RepID=UPI0030789638
MKTGFMGIVAAVLVLAAVLVYASAFVVGPTAQALVLQFGQVRRAIVQSGLYFKVPFIQNVEYLDRRILDLDLESQEVIAADQKRLIVDAFARYRISDPVKFFQAVRTVSGGNQRLNTFTSSALRAYVADATFAGVVRDHRAELMEKIKTAVDQQAKTIGIDIIDVRIRRADLPQQNSQAIFQRMQTERQREAAELRARGAEESQRIRSKSDAEKEIIIAEARRDADRLRGEGDAQRNRVFAEAFGKDPEFFAFYRSMQAYEAGLKAQDTRLLISPSSDFFRYFADPQGRPPQARATPALPPAPTPPAQPAPSSPPAQ